MIQDDVNYDGYKKHVAHKKAEAPLTQRERELEEIKRAEVKRRKKKLYDNER